VSCPELIKRFHDFWRDFNTVNRWKFPELSPYSLQKWLDLDLGRLDYAEFQRVEWMWRRKPRSLLGEGLSGYLLLVLVASLLLLVPHLGIFFAAAWCLATLVAIANDTVRLARWRREYESGMVRVIRSSQNSK
jgi:hypothetical protein